MPHYPPSPCDFTCGNGAGTSTGVLTWCSAHPTVLVLRIHGVVDAHHPGVNLWRACPITLGRGGAHPGRGAHATCVLNACVTRQVQHDLAMFFKHLP